MHNRTMRFVAILTASCLAVSAGELPEFGVASWYGYPFHGRAAADGSVYDMEGITAAHKTLPFGAWVRVTNLENSRTVDVRITDRGPFIAERIIDLSRAAARAIDIVDAGTAQVRLDVLALEPAAGLTTVASGAAAAFAVQAGAFRERGNAERLRLQMERLYGFARLQRKPGDPAVWRVLVGSKASAPEAGGLAASVRAQTGAAIVVRAEPPAAPDAAREPGALAGVID